LYLGHLHETGESVIEPLAFRAELGEQFPIDNRGDVDLAKEVLKERQLIGLRERDQRACV
jgi:hypothetical protein